MDKIITLPLAHVCGIKSYLVHDRRLNKLHVVVHSLSVVFVADASNGHFMSRYSS